MERERHVTSRLQAEELSKGGRLSPDFLESLSRIPRGDPLTWGATPLNPFYDGVLGQQADVEHVLYERAQHAIEGIPPHIATYVADTILTRFTGRQMASFDHYSTALNKELFDDTSDPSLRDISDRGLRGLANPAELIMVREAGQLGGIELGCITMDYNRNLDQLDAMREAMTKTIELYNGEPQSKERFSLKSANLRDDLSFGDTLLMTRKRDVAVLPDGTQIRERSSFIVRIDTGSNFDPSLTAAMQQIPFSPDNAWLEEVQKAGKLDDVVPELLAANDFTTIIPLAVTTYAFNKATIAEIAAHAEVKRSEDEARAAAFERDYPEISKLQRMQREKQRTLETLTRKSIYLANVPWKK